MDTAQNIGGRIVFMFCVCRVGVMKFAASKIIISIISVYTKIRTIHIISVPSDLFNWSIVINCLNYFHEFSVYNCN
jgi:hypothetical protein